MGNRTAKFISALVGSIIAGAPLGRCFAERAKRTQRRKHGECRAADCLASPKGAAPQGQHWFYRVERATKRQCWYLRAEGAKATQSRAGDGRHAECGSNRAAIGAECAC